MTPDDLAALHARAFPPGAAWDRSAFAGLLGAPGVIVLGTTHACLLARLAADEAEILTLAVAPEARRQGLARRLLSDLDHAARQAGVTTVFLEVAADNAPARALYAQAGYSQTGCRPGYYKRGRDQEADALILSKQL